MVSIEVAFAVVIGLQRRSLLSFLAATLDLGRGQMALTVVSTVMEELLTMVLEAAAGITEAVPQREMRRLRSTLETIRSVLDDAERRGTRDMAVRVWLRDLKDILQDGEDVIDLFDVEIQRQMPPGNRQLASSVCWPFSCFTRAAHTHQMALCVARISDRLNEISKERSRFQLSGGDVAAGRSDPLRSQEARVIRARTSSLINPDVVGVAIEEDTRKMVNLLLGDYPEHNPIFAITGMGGIGKTTLAQRVYGDPRIRACFDVRIWVCVSQDYIDVELLKGIISYVQGDYHGAHTRQQLEEILQNIIQYKKFLLVLDDVWSGDVWLDLLRNPLHAGASGSRVLITTRSQDVVALMAPAHSHTMRVMSAEDSWSLLCQIVFRYRDEVDRAKFKEVGDKILEKCGGLPLAIKCVGRFLRTKELRTQEWAKVLENLEWYNPGFNEEVMGALYLSYEALPSRIKPCFLYCALFPENRKLARKDLIQLWIAEGFVESGASVSLEDTAEGYYKLLLASSLLQQELDDFEEAADCRMHDLIRDLALKIAEDDTYTGNLGKFKEKATKLRRLSLGSREDMAPFEAIRGHESLRTLLIFNNPIRDDNKLWGFVNGLRFLRVLDLRGSGLGTTFPESVGRLVLLRYLNLSGTGISRLPNSIKDLRKLQFLNLNGCVRVPDLPRGIVQLQNLRSLDLLHTRVGEIPHGLSNLQQLNSLLGFMVCDNEHFSLEELKPLISLRDLQIENLEKVRGGSAELQSKQHLKSLVLRCKHDPNVSPQQIKAIFDKLCPPSCLEQLLIQGYFGNEFPKWMFSPSDFPYLVRLNLEECSCSEQIPPLGQLRELRYLCISASFKITNLNDEFFGDGEDSFPKLERLIIRQMRELEEWSGPDYGAFCSLKALRLIDCPKLISLPLCLEHATSLTELVITDADRLRTVDNLSSLIDLQIKDCPNLERISDLKALESLKVVKCPALEDVNNVPALLHLELTDFSLDSLPQWIDHHTSRVLRLDISGNKNLLEDLQQGGKEWPKVANIPHLYVHKDNSSYSSGPSVPSILTSRAMKHELWDSSNNEITSIHEM